MRCPKCNLPGLSCEQGDWHCTYCGFILYGSDFLPLTSQDKKSLTQHKEKGRIKKR